LRELIGDLGFLERHRFHSTDFTRKRDLTFVNVVMVLLNFLKGALQRELDEFFQIVQQSEVAERVVGKSAFCAARKKLKPSAFVELNDHLLRHWSRRAPVRRWRGLDLRSVDGTTLRLPDTEEAIAVFGQMEPAQSAPVTLARASHLYDPLNGLVLDAVIAPYHRDERSLLLDHLGRLTAGSLLLLDAGYPAFWLFAALQARKVAWCARMPLDGWHAVRDFLASGRPEAQVTLVPSPQMRRDCERHGVASTPLRVRLIRIRLSTGVTEVLVTTLLDAEEYPHGDFAALYFLRWGHEEHYKRFKSRMEIENWSGKTLLTIYQDFYAKVFSLNLTLILASAAQDIVDQRHATDRHPKQVNVAHALCTMKDAIVRLFRRADPEAILRALVETMSRTIEPVRPDRLYPRRKGPRLHSYPMAYKPCT
jgi:hypothetical protein